MYNRFAWVYIGLTAVVAAVSIILLVEFAWVDDVSDDKTKQMLAALTAALTTFIGSILVTTDETDATIGSLVEEKFIAAFSQAESDEIPAGHRYAVRANDTRWYLEMGSLGIRAANEEYAHATGWGRAARRRRAEDIEAYLRPE
ncbi:hypothetical protein [Terrabacter sp. Ter38]|uniref:hypothetical protein n=1 Tax=Terrabacter sp. Ter38 TaxID=2926030 RepID=UPI0021176789|nr:hypothetical protein [Terrabacter sp. Ter38]